VNSISELPAGGGTSASGVVPSELAIIEALFDHIPEIAFFLKDCEGRYVAVNQSLVERCGLRHKRELIGRRVGEIFPADLAGRYARQDQAVVRTGRPTVDHLELHWRANRRPGWCLTTKLPWRDATGAVVGVMGISRDLRTPGDQAVPPALAGALEELAARCGEAHTPGSLARRAGLPPVRFARFIRRIFRLTPNQLITQTRVNAAARLLAETNRPVADIALDCGFYDHSAMTRAFRSTTNLTPTRFRSLSQDPRPRGTARNSAKKGGIDTPAVNSDQDNSGRGW
jgi:PAS domain S-box-containing protein